MKFALKTLSFALSLSFAAGTAWAEGLGILHVGDQETWLLSAQGNLRVSTSQGISCYGGIDPLATVMANRRAEAAANNRFVLSLNAGDAGLPGYHAATTGGFSHAFANAGTNSLAFAAVDPVNSAAFAVSYLAVIRVPEPRDWMLMLAGIGLVGVMVGRNRRRLV